MCPSPALLPLLLLASSVHLVCLMLFYYDFSPHVYAARDQSREEEKLNAVADKASRLSLYRFPPCCVISYPLSPVSVFSVAPKIGCMTTHHLSHTQRLGVRGAGDAAQDHRHAHAAPRCDPQGV